MAQLSFHDASEGILSLVERVLRNYVNSSGHLKYVDVYRTRQDDLKSKHVFGGLVTNWSWSSHWLHWVRWPQVLWPAVLDFGGMSIRRVSHLRSYRDSRLL